MGCNLLSQLVKVLQAWGMQKLRVALVVSVEVLGLRPLLTGALLYSICTNFKVANQAQSLLLDDLTLSNFAQTYCKLLSLL